MIGSPIPQKTDTKRKQEGDNLPVDKPVIYMSTMKKDKQRTTCQFSQNITLKKEYRTDLSETTTARKVIYQQGWLFICEL